MRRGVRPSIAVLLVLLPVVLTFVWTTLTRGQTPSDGTATAPLELRWSEGSLGVLETFGPGVPLRAGDRVLAVDGYPVEYLAGHPGVLHVQAGDRLVYRVLRPVAGSAPTELDVGITVAPRYPLAVAVRVHWAVLPIVITMYLVATFVIVSQPRHRAARALYALAVLLPLGAGAFPLSTQVIEVVTGRIWPFVVADIINCLLWGALLHFALVFPDPHGFLSRRGTVLAGYAVPFVLYAGRTAVLLPQAPDALTRLEVLVPVSVMAAYVQPLLIAAAMASGYRSAVDELTRRRMRWAFSAFAVAAVTYIGLGQVPARLLGSPLIPWDWQTLLFVPFPVALGVAVLRYRLFDIEIILRRSLVYAAVSMSLAAVYLVVVAALSRLVVSPSGLAPMLGSVAVAVLFGPLRTQARRIVSRGLFGDRDDPYEVMNRLSRRLEATASVDSVLPALVETLAQTLRLSYAAIHLEGAGEQPVRYGVPTGRPMTVPITHAGEHVGSLEIDAGPGREPFGVNDQRLLDGLARQVGVISQNLLLESRLRHSLERIVTAREEERRRLRRDIHDNLGPTLASVAIQAELARDLVAHDPDRAAAILHGLASANREAVVGLRRLVDGLRPPVLDRLGLVGALREQAAAFSAGRGRGADQGESPPEVIVDAEDGIEPLPAAVEVAAFHIVQESMTNVVRHAGARHCRVRVWREPQALLLQVLDDGRGLTPGYRAGVGLGSIRERATELGGQASVTPGPDGGTLVRARLPVRSGAGPADSGTDDAAQAPQRPTPGAAPKS